DTDVGDTRPNGLGTIAQDCQLDIWRQRRPQPRQKLVNSVNRLDDVAPRLALNVEDDGRSTIEPSADFRVLGSEDSGTDIAHADWSSIAVREDHIRIGLRCQDLIISADHECLVGAVEAALRLIDIRAA